MAAKILASEEQPCPKGFKAARRMDDMRRLLEYAILTFLLAFWVATSAFFRPQQRAVPVPPASK
jgi:hypothetical protein